MPKNHCSNLWIQLLYGSDGYLVCGGRKCIGMLRRGSYLMISLITSLSTRQGKEITGSLILCSAGAVGLPHKHS